MNNICTSVWPRAPPDIGAINQDIDDNLHPNAPDDVESEGTRKIFAYIVCVNEYKKGSSWNLRGCLNDGQKFESFLHVVFPDSEIEWLTNDRATHDAIMSVISPNTDTFRKGDTIIFFYAGHGGRSPSPGRWQTDDSHIEFILPYDVDTTRPDGSKIYGIPDFVIANALGRLAMRGMNVVSIFDCCYSSGMARDINVNEHTSTPRFREAPSIPESMLDELLSKYSQGPIQNFTLLAASDKREPAREGVLRDGTYGGRFTAVLIETFNKLQWPESNMSYATLYKNLPPLHEQTPKFIGATSRFLFSLREAPDDGLYFDITEEQHPYYSVQGAGSALGIRPGAKFEILSPEYREIGSLKVERDGVEASQCRARAESHSNDHVSIPLGARALLHNWSLYDRPLQVAVEAEAPRPEDTGAVQVVDRSSEADIIITKHSPSAAISDERRQTPFESHMELTRNTLFIVESTGIPTIKLSATTTLPELQAILDKVAHFNYHLLRRSTLPLGDAVTVELYRVQDVGGRLYTENREQPENLLVGDSLVVPFQEGAIYGVLIKNNSEYQLYPNVFYLDPSAYSIDAVLAPSRESATPIPPKGNFPVGYGESVAPGFQFPLEDTELYDVGFIRIFLSTDYVKMKGIEQTSISEIETISATAHDIADDERHYKPYQSASRGRWDVRTIIVRVTRDDNVRG